MGSISVRPLLDEHTVNCSVRDDRTYMLCLVISCWTWQVCSAEIDRTYLSCSKDYGQMLLNMFDFIWPNMSVTLGY